MHLQPIYQPFPFVAAEEGLDVDSDIFERGLCLPSDIRMTDDQLIVITEAIRCCFLDSARS